MHPTALDTAMDTDETFPPTVRTQQNPQVGGGAEQDDLRSPEPKGARRAPPAISGEEMRSLFGSMATQVQNGFAGTHSRLDRVDSILREHGGRLERVEKRCDALEAQREEDNRRASSPSRSATTASGEEVVGILGGFARDSKKKLIEDWIAKHLPEFVDFGAFAPGPRTSIAIIKFRSKEQLRYWAPRVRDLADKSPTGKLWLSPSRTPEQRARRRQLYALSQALAPFLREGTHTADHHPGHGILWVNDRRITEVKDGGKGWTLHENTIHELFGQEGNNVLQALREAV